MAAPEVYVVGERKANAPMIERDVEKLLTRLVPVQDGIPITASVAMTLNKNVKCVQNYVDEQGVEDCPDEDVIELLREFHAACHRVRDSYMEVALGVSSPNRMVSHNDSLAEKYRSFKSITGELLDSIIPGETGSLVCSRL
jgi:hypothetical protein